MKRRKNKKIKILIFIICLFLFLFCSVSYSLLSQRLKIHGRINLLAEQSSNAGDSIIDKVEDTDSGLVENIDGSYGFVGDENASVTNFIKLPVDEILWRIISIDSLGNIKIIRGHDASLKMEFDSNNQANDWANTAILQNLKNWYQAYLSPFSYGIV